MIQSLMRANRTTRCLAVALLAAAAILAGCDDKPETAPNSPRDTIGASGTAGASGTETPRPVAANPTGRTAKKFDRLKIAVIPKGTTHDFWKSIHAGAVKAAQEIGNVDIIFRGPEKEDDREQQIKTVENFITSGVDAIVLAPLDNKALVLPVRQATNARMPVVIIDSGLDAKIGIDYASYVATDNHKGGQLAAGRLGDALGGKGKVLLLRYQEGSASTMERERGFVEGIGKFKDIELIDPKRYAGPTRDSAQQTAENLLAGYPQVNGIFCPNESSTFGMLLALRARNLTGKVKFVGFDASPGLVKALADKEIDALVVQNPMKMGYLGVKTAVQYIKTQKVKQQQDTGVELVTHDNMGNPEMKDLLNPDLKKYLGG